MSANAFKLTILATGLCGLSAAHAVTLDLNKPYNVFQTYGNTNVYSLPVQAGIYNDIYGGGTGPGNPYYVTSTPGAIKDLVVIYTGASGTDVTTNAAGFEDAYLTPSGKTIDYASMGEGTSGVGVVNPGSKAGIAHSSDKSWDASLLALKGFLAGGDAVFLFNNNDTNKDQNLAIWAKLWITDASGATYNNRYLYLSNMGNPYDALLPPGNALTYDPGNVTPGIYPGTPETTDWVKSGGEICFTAGWAPTSCAGTYAHKINHNLGANQAAYAGMLPLFDSWLDGLFTLSDSALDQYTMHLDLRMGCTSGWSTCDDRKIDNGYEQLFLASTKADIVPEPGTLALFALSLLGLGMVWRNRYSGARA